MKKWYVSPVLWAGLGIVVVAGGVTYWMLQKENSSSGSDTVAVATVSPFPSSSASVAVSPTPSPIPTVTLLSDQGVTWLKTPEKLADLGIITATDATAISYYKVGSDNGKDLVYIYSGSGLNEGPGTALILIRKVSGSKYEIIDGQSLSTFFWDERVDFKKTSNIVQGSKVVYNSIVRPAKLTIQGQDFTSPFVTFSGLPFFSASDYESATVIQKTQYGDVYRVVAKKTFGVASQQNLETMILKALDGIAIQYTPVLSYYPDTQIPDITWNNGSKNTVAYNMQYAVSKCGSKSGNSVYPGTLDGFTATGKTSSGSTVYEASSVSNALLAEVFDTLGGEYYNSDTGKTVSITISQYLAGHGMLVIQDGLGRNLVYTSTKYSPAAECGKPVIYLYPTKTTDVSVKVGAKITVSEPTYNNGWHVTAQPNGQLTVSGKKYDSLFWEGLGLGNYPTLTSGTVVAKADVEKTLRQQLAAQGLNTKESADFLEFWLPKMPTTPYTLLSWLTTDEMNKLAPLAVNPRPDTMIRVFLDFRGLTEPISVPTQTFSAPERKGFTLVEWGGLLKK